MSCLNCGPANCDQRHDTCVYNTSAPFKFAEENDSSPRRAGSQSRSDPAGPASESPNLLSNFDFTNPSSTPPSLDMKSLELVLQWIQHTHRLFARNEETRQVWEMPVLQEALQAPFLMHGILALSALHLSHFQSDEKSSEWLNTALAHKNTALSMFSEQLPNITQSNAKAMMSFAALAVAFSFATSLNLIPSEEGPGLRSLTNIFTLSRGVQTVFNAEARFLRKSNFSPLFDVIAPDEPVPDQYLEAFERLEKLNVECYRQLSDHDMITYQRAIAYMRELAPFTFAERTSLTLLVGWAIRAPGKYLEDLNESNPFALVVLAHYCVFMHLARENWCVGPWGRIVLQEISQILPPEWHGHIEWALEQVSTGTNQSPQIV